MVKSKYQRSSKHISERKSYKSSAGFSLSLKKVFFFVLTLFIIAGGFYFVLISENFKIKDVVVSGTETISQDAVLDSVNKVFEQEKLGFLSSQNYFLFPVGELEASVRGEFPKIGALEIKKINPDGLEVNIGERESIGVWCLATRDLAKPDGLQDGNCFYFDKLGIIFEQAPRTTGSLMLSVYDERGSVASLGDPVLEGEQISFFQDTHNIVVRNFPFGVKKIIITSDGELELTTSEDWLILLDKKESPEYQLSNLKYVLDEEIKTRRRELEYVDLQLGNRVYYKYKN